MTSAVLWFATGAIFTLVVQTLFVVWLIARNIDKIMG